jgi:hypothetical protein
MYCEFVINGAGRCDDSGIAGAHFVRDGNSIAFVDETETASRCFAVNPGNKYAFEQLGPFSYPLTVSGYVVDPDGTRRDLQSLRFAVRDDFDPAVIASAGFRTPNPCTFEPPNDAPVAAPDQWVVAPGASLTVPPPGVLDNDVDPDGDKLTAQVQTISFASGEWSGLAPDGSFAYNAGPGTSRRLEKTVTYVAIDEHGARSQPTTAIVVVDPALSGGGGGGGGEGGQPVEKQTGSLTKTKSDTGGELVKKDELKGSRTVEWYERGVKLTLTLRANYTAQIWPRLISVTGSASARANRNLRRICLRHGPWTVTVGGSSGTDQPRALSAEETFLSMYQNANPHFRFRGPSSEVTNAARASWTFTAADPLTWTTVTRRMKDIKLSLAGIASGGSSGCTGTPRHPVLMRLK